MTTTWIYGLVDPRDGKTKYVGKSDRPKRRVVVHISRAKCKKRKSKKDVWLLDLVNEGLRPSLKLLEEVDDEQC